VRRSSRDVHLSASAAAAKLAVVSRRHRLSRTARVTDCFGSNRRPTSLTVTPSSTRSARIMRLASTSPPLRGAPQCRWTLRDYVDIVLQHPAQTSLDFYALDRLWRDCPPPVFSTGSIWRRCYEGTPTGDCSSSGQTGLQRRCRTGQLDTELSELGRDQRRRRRGVG